MYLGRVFGNQVDITYHDAALEEVREQFADALEEAANRYWPYPLVLMQGQVVMAGHIDAYRLSEWITQELREQ
jgi:disulfide oxidoreductase YuzD